MLINSFELDAYVSFILWRPLVCRAALLSCDCQTVKREKKGSLPPPESSSYPDYRELSSSLLKWKL